MGSLPMRCPGVRRSLEIASRWLSPPRNASHDLDHSLGRGVRADPEAEPRLRPQRQLPADCHLSPGQQPVAAWSVRQASAMRAAGRMATRLRSVSRGIVWRLSKLTTLSVGTPSAGESASSETSPRRVRVSAATTTEPMRSATGSRVRTRTGRSPPGVAANQISPRRIDGPIRPVLRGAPVGDLAQRSFALVEWCGRPPVCITFGCQPIEVPAQGFAQQLGTVDAERLGPSSGLVGISVGDTEAEHCHTPMIDRMTCGAQIAGAVIALDAAEGQPGCDPRSRLPAGVEQSCIQ